MARREHSCVLPTPRGQPSLPGLKILAGSTVDAVLSAGAIPDVTGLTVDQAQALLEQVGLGGIVGGDGAYSDAVPEGSVVEILGASTQTFSPGDHPHPRRVTRARTGDRAKRRGRHDCRR